MLIFILCLAVYIVIGGFISWKVFKETMADIPNMPRSESYKSGEIVFAYIGLPLTALLWPLPLLYGLYEKSQRG